MVSLASLHFRVLIELRGIPAHAWNVNTSQIILGSACFDLVEAPTHIDRNNNSAILFVVCWCMHPDLVPMEKLILIPKPLAPYVECGLS